MVVFISFQVLAQPFVRIYRGELSPRLIPDENSENGWWDPHNSVDRARTAFPQQRDSR